jgi:hypothetical protein
MTQRKLGVFIAWQEDTIVIAALDKRVVDITILINMRIERIRNQTGVYKVGASASFLSCSTYGGDGGQDDSAILISYLMRWRYGLCTPSNCLFVDSTNVRHSKSDILDTVSTASDVCSDIGS